MPTIALPFVARATVVGGILLCALGISPAKASAQLVRDARASVVFAGGIAQLPDALSTQCGSKVNGGGGIGLEAGGGFLYRPWRWMVILADTRVAAPLASGCYLTLPAVDTSYSRAAKPFTASTLRVGVETPRGAPLVRLAIGSGVVWGGPALPLTVLTAGWSTRGPGKRFFAEIERAQTRFRATEAHNFPPSFTQQIVVHPVVYTVRAGVEVPLRPTP